jgi:hypothetical protein
MFCPYCGSQIVDDARFCMSCGQAVPGVAPAQPTEPTPEMVSQVPPVEPQAQTYQAPYLKPPVQLPPGAQPINNHLAPAIVITGISFLIGCCWPLGWIFGIVAISYASRSNSLLAAGDYNGAVTAAHSAKTWCWIAAITGIALPCIFYVLAAIGGFANGAHIPHIWPPHRMGRII